MMDVKRIGSKFSFFFCFPFFMLQITHYHKFIIMFLVPLLRDILALKSELMYTIPEEC
jgi:hypothetical protein